MPFSNLDMKKAYYYVICVMAFFILMWGTVDLISTSVGIYIIKDATPSLSSPADEAPPSAEKSEQFFDAYYQKKMLFDRFWDSLARILVSGLIFIYFRFSAHKLEQQA
jgi:hypothetical protein